MIRGIHLSLGQQLRRWLVIAVILLITVACTDYDYDQPNTPANRAGFERHVGFEVPDTVSDLYYYADELGVDVTYQLGFAADRATVDRIVAELNLVQREATFNATFAREFDWWDADAVEALTPYGWSNDDGDYYRILWYDPTAGRVYYLEYSL
jgi:hypothetical protein